MSSSAEVFDAAGVLLAPGIDLGDGERVIEVRADDEGGAPTLVTNCDTWPTRPRDYRREGPHGPYVWVCDDVSSAARTRSLIGGQGG